MASKSGKSLSEPDFILHTYYRSSCSGRLRIALGLKLIQAEHVHVHLFKGEQLREEYIKLNPSGSVPVLTHHPADGTVISITQSVAALEYLEEILPDQVPLLPPSTNPRERAKVRELVNVISNDLQPVTNRRTGKALEDLGASPERWIEHFTTRGLRAYEGTAAKSAGKYSVGDNVTIADVCLVPAVWNAEQGGIQIDEFPTIARVYKALSELEAIQRAHWSCQPDTPADKAWL